MKRKRMEKCALMNLAFSYRSHQQHHDIMNSIGHSGFKYKRMVTESGHKTERQTRWQEQKNNGSTSNKHDLSSPPLPPCISHLRYIAHSALYISLLSSLLYSCTRQSK